MGHKVGLKGQKSVQGRPAYDEHRCILANMSESFELLRLTLEDQSTTSHFDGSVTILPNTVKMTQNLVTTLIGDLRHAMLRDLWQLWLSCAVQ